MKDQLKTLNIMFRARPNEWIPLPDIQKVAAQYNTRIYELRNDHKMNIQNKTQDIAGVRHSWYMFIPAREEQLEMAGV